jgi:hypothetical protein
MKSWVLLGVANTRKRLAELPKTYVLTIGIIPDNGMVTSPNFVPYYFIYV